MSSTLDRDENYDDYEENENINNGHVSQDKIDELNANVTKLAIETQFMFHNVRAQIEKASTNQLQYLALYYLYLYLMQQQVLKQKIKDGVSFTAFTGKLDLDQPH